MNYDGATARPCLRWHGTGMVLECHCPIHVKDLRTGGDGFFLFNKRIFGLLCSTEQMLWQDFVVNAYSVHVTVSEQIYFCVHPSRL